MRGESTSRGIGGTGGGGEWAREGVGNGRVGGGGPVGGLWGGTANGRCGVRGLGTKPGTAAGRLMGECEPVRIAVGKMTRPDGFSRHFLVMAGSGLGAGDPPER